MIGVGSLLHVIEQRHITILFSCIISRTYVSSSSLFFVVSFLIIHAIVDTCCGISDCHIEKYFGVRHLKREATKQEPEWHSTSTSPNGYTSVIRPSAID